MFLTRSDLNEKDQRDFATLLTGVEGIVVEGRGKVVSTQGWRCLYFMVNKVPVSSVPRGVPGSTAYWTDSLLDPSRVGIEGLPRDMGPQPLIDPRAYVEELNRVR